MKGLNYCKKVTIADITVRDGFQREERFISTNAKLWVIERLILAGFRHMEVTNFANPRSLPQFADAEDILRRVRTSKVVKHLVDSVELTAITINKAAVTRAIEAKKAGFGPDRILMLVSVSEAYQKKNSGMSVEASWKMAEECIPLARDAGIKVCGAINSIWGCPLGGPMDLQTAVDFSKRWIDIGAHDIEHADHDGSASPDRVFDYFSRVMEILPDSSLHVAHFHSTRGWGLANVLAALQAGITQFEATMGGLGGQPANFMGDTPLVGTGDYYHSDPNISGLVSTEDMVVMMDEMGIDTGLDVDAVLKIGAMTEKIVGRKLRSECVHSGRIPKEVSGRK